MRSIGSVKAPSVQSLWSSSFPLLLSWIFNMVTDSDVETEEESSVLLSPEVALFADEVRLIVGIDHCTRPFGERGESNKSDKLVESVERDLVLSFNL
mmetsp:Transcript_18989/g.30893  ORF Transcript_18989/g.30893 Transcript_18989/m.30893 type:complete len:97 (+) Transcript_18989:985-1275(+)